MTAARLLNRSACSCGGWGGLRRSAAAHHQDPQHSLQADMYHNIIKFPSISVNHRKNGIYYACTYSEMYRLADMYHNITAGSMHSIAWSQVQCILAGVKVDSLTVWATIMHKQNPSELAGDKHLPGWHQQATVAACNTKTSAVLVLIITTSCQQASTFFSHFEVLQNASGSLLYHQSCYIITHPLAVVRC